jgi:hypothetical protein
LGQVGCPGRAAAAMVMVVMMDLAGLLGRGTGLRRGRCLGGR